MTVRISFFPVVFFSFSISLRVAGVGDDVLHRQRRRHQPHPLPLVGDEERLEVDDRLELALRLLHRLAPPVAVLGVAGGLLHVLEVVAPVLEVVPTHQLLGLGGERGLVRGVALGAAHRAAAVGHPVPEVVAHLHPVGRVRIEDREGLVAHGAHRPVHQRLRLRRVGEHVAEHERDRCRSRPRCG